MGHCQTLSSASVPVIRYYHLAEFVQQFVAAHDEPAEDAETAVNALVKANLRGVDSHGIAREPMYCERLRRNVTSARPNLRSMRVAPAVAQVDGDDGLGLVVGKFARAEAIALARDTGIALASVRRSPFLAANPFAAVTAGWRQALVRIEKPAVRVRKNHTF